ncbi:MAG: MotA/TolQ/ExbB proton channel family protein [Candidatus Brocadiia bacterium]
MRVLSAWTAAEVVCAVALGVAAAPGAQAGSRPQSPVSGGPLRVGNVGPATAVAGRATELTIRGQGFSDHGVEVTVTVAGEEMACTDVRVQSPRRLKATVPEELAAGRADVTVVNPDGEWDTLEDAVYFVDPGRGFSWQATLFQLRQDWRGFLEWFKLGGPLMYVLAAISFFGVAWAVHCLLVLRRSQILPQKFMEDLSSHLMQSDVRGAAAACERTRCVFGKVILTGLRKVSEAPEKIREAVAAAGSREAAHLHQKISYLANIGTISPMLGLLGTVFGMIMAFNIISSGEVRHYMLAAAIAQAMVTTAAGLVIGIPAMAVYFYLRGRLLRLMTHMEVVADEVAQTIIDRGAVE